MLAVDITGNGTRACRPAMRVEIYQPDGRLAHSATAQRGLLYPACSIRQIFKLPPLGTRRLRGVAHGRCGFRQSTTGRSSNFTCHDETRSHGETSRVERRAPCRAGFRRESDSRTAATVTAPRPGRRRRMGRRRHAIRSAARRELHTGLSCDEYGGGPSCRRHSSRRSNPLAGSVCERSLVVVASGLVVGDGEHRPSPNRRRPADRHDSLRRDGRWRAGPFRVGGRADSDEARTTACVGRCAVLPGSWYIDVAGLTITNDGNLVENVALEVRSTAGSIVRAPWTHGTVSPGEKRRVIVDIRAPVRPQRAGRDTVTARATTDTADAEAGYQFDVVPAGRNAGPPRNALPTALAIRFGSRRDPGFGSFVGSGALDRDRQVMTTFSLATRDRSNPLSLNATSTS